MARNTVCHIEYHTVNLRRGQGFYEAVFGWTFKPFTDDMVIFASGDQHIGGLIQKDSVKPASYPSVYFDVEDVDATIARAKALGGAAIEEKHSVLSVGWSAVIGDPDGNPVGIVQFT